MRIAVVAAEPSGDQLGAGLMRALQERLPDACFEGIGGTQMQGVGMQSLAPMEILSVMGLVEVLSDLPRLLRLRRTLLARWLDDPPDLFIGIDAPDFNFHLERRLRAAGVPTVHYVSPTVWAWREGRVQTIREATDLLLSIFPFEPEFLESRGVHTVYVGHRLGAEMPLEPDRVGARLDLGLSPEEPVLAVLPGSRKGEVERLARPFLQSASICAEQVPGLQIVTPLVNEEHRALWRTQRDLYAPGLEVREVVQDSRRALAAADVVLTASGTATFEALLSKRPMVVGYKLNPFTYWLARTLRLVRLEHVAMANLLTGEGLAPEFIQGACEPAQLVPALMVFFHDPERVKAIQGRYSEVHHAMIMDTDQRAAEAVLDLLRERGRLPNQ